MIDEPQITDTTVQLTAVIHLKVPPAEMRTVVGAGIGELMATVAAQGIGPAGPWYMHYLHMGPEACEFEIGVPVRAPVASAGRVIPGQLPATKVARTIFKGGYDGLGSAWAEFEAWIKTAGHTAGTGRWEGYFSGPEASPDPTTWRTELNRPLAN